MGRGDTQGFDSSSPAHFMSVRVGFHMALRLRHARKTRAHTKTRAREASQAWARLSNTGGEAGTDT